MTFQYQSEGYDVAVIPRSEKDKKRIKSEAEQAGASLDKHLNGNLGMTLVLSNID